MEKPIDANKEKFIKLETLLIYPIASVRSCEVDYLDIGPLGIRYDRELTVYDVKTTNMLTNADHLPINDLR